MNRDRRGLIAVLIAVLVIAALWLQGIGRRDGGPSDAGDGRPVIVATFSILGDLIRHVAGEDADVRVLTRAGEEVHEWELTVRNFVDIEEADVIFSNGLNLEQWMHQVRGAARKGVPIVAVGEESGYPVRDVLVGEFRGTPDPHVWMDVKGAMAYVELIRDTLAEIDPDRAEQYHRNAERYLGELAALDAELREMLGTIPPERRVLITSEAAFQYFAEAYGFIHQGIWGLNSEQEGSPQQLMAVIEVIERLQPAALFWESTISDRYVRNISEGTGVPIAGPLYVDSLALVPPGDTYIGMMRANAELLLNVLQ